MPTLADFQTEATEALNNPDSGSPRLVKEKDADGSSRRFNIYRNNRASSLTDALQSTYPVLYRLTGDTFFKAAARQFIDMSPPKGPVLSEYGETFGHFVQQLPGTTDYPYLADIAQLEWQRLQAFHAADQKSLSLHDLQSIDPSTLATGSMIPLDATRLVKSDWAIGSLWESINSESESRITLAQPECVLITRPELDVNIQLLDPPCTIFFEHLQRGSTIVEAASEALVLDEGFNTGLQLQALLSMGAFTAMSD